MQKFNSFLAVFITIIIKYLVQLLQSILQSFLTLYKSSTPNWYFHFHLTENKISL